jgi:hypothetical protein
MISRFILSVLLLWSLANIHASAQDSKSGNWSLGGEAPPLCAFSALPSSLTSENMTLTPGSATSKIIIDNMIDPATARLNTASLQFEIAGTCNQPHYVSVMTKNGGLIPNDGVGNEAFMAHVNYRVQVDWAGQTSLLTTNAIPGKKTSPLFIGGPNKGPLNVWIAIDAQENDMERPYIAGLYTDILTVQIGTQL